MIDHPSYKNNMGCAEDDVREAVVESAKSGETVELRYSETAARILSEICDWESEQSYSYQGTDGDDERPWRVDLVES